MRQIFIVNATQVVVSDAHPEGLYSVIPNYPRSFDSRSYPSADGNPNGDEEKALNMAKSAYLAQLSTNYANANPTRVMMGLSRVTTEVERSSTEESNASIGFWGLHHGPSRHKRWWTGPKGAFGYVSAAK